MALKKSRTPRHPQGFRSVPQTSFSEPARRQAAPADVLAPNSQDLRGLTEFIASAVAQALSGLTVTVVLRQADGARRASSGMLQTQQRTAGLRGIPGIAGAAPVVK